MIAKLLREMTCDKNAEFPEGIKPMGTLIRHPNAYRLVNIGVAEPVDDECAEACGHMTAAQIEAAGVAYERVARGIHPDDYEAYDAGYMIGYNPDGTWKRGPNFEAWLAELEEDDDDE